MNRPPTPTPPSATRTQASPRSPPSNPPKSHPSVPPVMLPQSAQRALGWRLAGQLNTLHGPWPLASRSQLQDSVKSWRAPRSPYVRLAIRPARIWAVDGVEQQRLDTLEHHSLELRAPACRRTTTIRGLVLSGRRQDLSPCSKALGQPRVRRSYGRRPTRSRPRARPRCAAARSRQPRHRAHDLRRFANER